MMRSSSSSTVAELLEFQKSLAHGTLADGYLRAAEPLAVQKLIEAGSSRCEQLKELQKFFPLLSSTCADVIFYSPKRETFIALDINRLRLSECAVRLDLLLQDLESKFFLREMLSPHLHERGLATQGQIPWNLCYSFTEIAVELTSFRELFERRLCDAKLEWA